MNKILIIEDDYILRQQVKEVLEGYQYEVEVVENFTEIEQKFNEVKPDLVLLDINLPYYDGNYYCKLFRRISKVPIIITSARNSDMDQILSIELGADEYIVKPFNIQVLMAKVNAIMRRLYGEYTKQQGSDKNVIAFHGIQIDEKGFKVSYNNKTEELSKNEFKLIKSFLTNPDRVLTREFLLEELWDLSDFVDDNTLTVNVTRVKNRLLNLGLHNVIRTKRGVGYWFDSQGVSKE